MLTILAWMGGLVLLALVLAPFEAKPAGTYSSKLLVINLAFVAVSVLLVLVLALAHSIL